MSKKEPKRVSDKPKKRNGNSVSPAPVSTLDKVDEQIIAELRRSGRIGNRELANQLGINEATARSRIRRLEADNVVRVVAVRDLSAMGFGSIAAVGVQVKGRAASEVGKDLAKIDNVVTVNVTIGMYDLEIQVVAQDTDELDRLLTDVIAHVAGVERLFAGLSLKILKYNNEWAPL